METEAKAPYREPSRAPSIMVAEFDTPHDVLHAAERVRDAGYQRCQRQR